MDGDLNTYLIKGLSPSTEYEVLLAAVYWNEVESDEVILVESTGKRSVPPAASPPIVFVVFLHVQIVLTADLYPAD